MDLNSLTPEELEKKKQILEIEKLEKEKEKLEHENKKARRSFVFNPDNWAPMLTVIGAALALFFAYKSRWFDIQAKYLDYRNENLAYDNRKLDSEKVRTKFSVDSMKNVLTEQNRRSDSLINKLVGLAKADSILKHSIINTATQKGIINEIKNIVEERQITIIVGDSLTLEPINDAVLNDSTQKFGIVKYAFPEKFNIGNFYLTPGLHYLKITAPGYIEKKFDINLGVNKELRVLLRRKRFHSDAFDNSFD